LTIFNPAYFLRHISLPTLRQFTDAHPLGPELAIDWGQPEDSLPRLLTEALTVKQDSLSDAELSSKDREWGRIVSMRLYRGYWSKSASGFF